MKKGILLLGFAFLISGITGCKATKKIVKESERTVAESASDPLFANGTYEANLTALNSSKTGFAPSGTATFVVENDVIRVKIKMTNTPPEMEHWQHFHGFTDENFAQCADANLDENGDGFIDVVETEPVSGTTMVPFNAVPADMDVGDSSYPKSDSEGNYEYETVIPRGELSVAFGAAFGGQSLNLDRRVLYIHGVPDDLKLPSSVATVHDIDPHITLPIACGKIMKLSR